MKRLNGKLSYLLVGVISFPYACDAQRPLPFLKTNDVIVFQGDSITDGGRQRTGSDFNHTMGQDYAYILAAEIGADEPGKNFEFLNRGISGDRVLDLSNRWNADTLDIKPALLSILVGVNDVFASGAKAETLEQFRTTYDQLLARTIAALPATRIVLGEPFLLAAGKHKQAYAQELEEVQKRQQVVIELAAKYHLPLVHYQRMFDAAASKSAPERWSWDGVHPTYAGHALMAREWLRTVDDMWGRKEH